MYCISLIIFFFLGMFVHAILQPVLNKATKGSGKGLNPLTESDETWSVFMAL